MFQNTRFRNYLFIVLAIGALLAAVYHMVGLFYPINDAPVWRHALFVAINLLLAICLYKRPAFFLPLFALLMLQQFYSHGTELITAWSAEHRVDWPSVLVLIFLPITLYALWVDYRSKKQA